eukprot:TRINITY_DN19206_c0_g1_i1.p1 TRINITY_DN19206_c0_g1~~TRINITY_DN19206_c0_g1_i1.p1  ORF type:complete len:1342 (+),score=219.43 TRINITY_DN19206_c0_g1_i1:55-4026(+)
MSSPSACLAACEAVVPLAQAALETKALPAEVRGQLLLKIGDTAGVLLTAVHGRGHATLWQAPRAIAPGQSPMADATPDTGVPSQPPQADATIRFDSVDSFRRALTDEKAIPGLLVRRKLRIEGDLSALQKLNPNGGGGFGMMSSCASASSPEAELFRSFARELDKVLAEAVAESEGAQLLSRCPSVSTVWSAAPWVPDEAASTCMSCSKAFSFIRRRHHCRGCGRLLCNACAPRTFRMPLPQDMPRRTASCPMLQGQIAPTKRICHDCRTRAFGTPSFSSFGTSTASASFMLDGSLLRSAQSVPSQPELVRSESPQEMQKTAGDQNNLQELRDQIRELRDAEALRTEQRIRHEIQSIWFQTQVAFFCLGSLLVLLSSRVAMAWAMLVLTLRYVLPARSLLSRMLRVWWAAFVIFVRVKLTRWRLRGLGLTDGKEYDAEWTCTHQVLGRFLYEQIVQLQGFWIKLGQQLSVNVMLPEPYRKELSKLQDTLPSMPVHEVLATMKEELGHTRASTIFVDPDAPPLGTASIAQVHKAVWQPVKDGPPREIVIKVQHRGVERMFRQDLFNSTLLSHLLVRIDPQGVPDLRPVIKSLKEVTLNELDFRLEAANQTKAAQAVSEAGVQVIIPQVVPELVARRAMAMDYVDGEPLTKAADKLSQADRDQLVVSLVDHFGVQFAVDGHFHADPHPGNLLVERGTNKLVVLDWGMCVTLSAKVTRGFAELFFAAATSNVWAYVKAMESVGLQFKDGDVFEPLMFVNLMRFILRDSKPILAAKDDMDNFVKIQDDMYWKGPKRWQKSPVDVLTGDMLYFAKALELVFSVSSQLGAHHPILLSLFRRSYETLKRNSLTCRLEHATSIPWRPSELLPSLLESQLTSQAACGKLQQQLLKILADAYKSGCLLGAQLCVLELPEGGARPRLLVDLSVGVRSWLQPDPISASTLFNLLDISKLPLAIAMLRLVEAGKLSLSRAIPGLASTAEGTGQITLHHILSHKAGLWQPLPSSMAELRQLLDFEAMMTAVLSMPAAEAPGIAQRYHHTSFGYLCAAACRHLANQELHETWHPVAEAAGVASMALEGGAPCTKKHSLLMHLRPEKKTSGAQTDAQDVAHVQGEASSAGDNEIASLMVNFSNMLELASGSNARKGQPAEGNPFERVARELCGRDHLLHPSLFAGDEEAVSSAVLPGLQAFGSARSVACLLASTSRERVRGGILSGGMLEKMLQSQNPAKSASKAGCSGVDELADVVGHVLNLEHFQDFGLGVQLVDPQTWGGKKSEKPAWGHLSQIGSVALVLPGEKPLAVSLLLNMAPRGDKGHQLAWSVLRALQAA